jgi:parallel beta-helix repeat protein
VVLKSGNNARTHIIIDQYGGSTNFVIKDITLDGNQVNQTNFHNGKPIQLINSSTNWLIENVTVRNAYTHSISVTNASYGTIINCHMENNGYSGLVGGAAIKLHTENNSNYEVHDVNVVGNIVDSSEAHGIHLKYQGSYNNIIENNVVKNTDEDTILLGGTGYDNAAHNNIVRGNVFENATDHGIDFYYGYGNNVYDNQVIDPDDYGIQMTFANDNIIHNNIVVGAGSSSVWRSGIRCVGSYNTITDNRVEASRSSGIEVEQGQENSLDGNIVIDNGGGIKLRKQSTNNEITNNVIIDTSAAYDDGMIITDSDSTNNYFSSNQVYDYDSNLENDLYSGTYDYIIMTEGEAQSYLVD